MSSTLGAPLGGTTVAATRASEWHRLPITPPNFGAGAGICFPWIVVVALGERRVPVASCAADWATAAGATAEQTAPR